MDDASDYTTNQKKYIKKRLHGHIVIFNKKRKHSVYNGYHLIHKYAVKKNSLVVIVDADDWLANIDSLRYIADTFANSKSELYFSYGTSYVWDGMKIVKSVPKKFSTFLNTSYPKYIVKNNLYRKDPFRIFHPMVFRVDIFNRIAKNDFMEAKGVWLKYCFDLAIFLPILEMSNGNYKLIRKPLYVYNMSSPGLNTKINPVEFVREDLIIRMKKRYESIQ